jgi:hypothetical protein
MRHVFFPAFAEQCAGQTVLLGLGEQVVSLQVTAAGSVDDDPFGELAAGMIGSQRGNQFAVPEVFMGGIELVGTRTAKKYG